MGADGEGGALVDDVMNLVSEPGIAAVVLGNNYLRGFTVELFAEKDDDFGEVGVVVFELKRAAVVPDISGDLADVAGEILGGVGDLGDAFGHKPPAAPADAGQHNQDEQRPYELQHQAAGRVRLPSLRTGGLVGRLIMGAVLGRGTALKGRTVRRRDFLLTAGREVHGAGRSGESERRAVRKLWKNGGVLRELTPDGAQAQDL